MSIHDLAEAAGLSPDDHDLLSMLLAEEGVSLEETHVIPRCDRSGDLPLSLAQESLWFIDQLTPGNLAYNMPSPLRISGPLDLGALDRTLSELVRRHETLRTVFAVHGGRPVQVVLPARPVFTPRIDLEDLPETVRETEARQIVIAEIRHPFDLSTGPLLRFVLVRLSPVEHLALFTMHHIVSDGWSTGVLMNELGLLYSALSQGLPPPLPELPVQYADFAYWQRSWLDGDGLEAQLAYWRKHLAGAPGVLDLSTDRPRPPVRSYRGAVRAMLVERTVGDELVAICRRENATSFMILLAGFGALLQRYTHQDDLIVGTTIANRHRRELEGLIGFFINSLALRTDLGGDPTCRELLRRVRDMALAAYAHQDVPFDRLVGELGIKRDLSRSPLFQVIFQLQNTPSGDLYLPGLTLSMLELEMQMAKFDLLLSLSESSLGFGGLWRYSPDLFDDATVARMSLHLEALLAGIAAGADQRLSELPLLSAPERQQLLAEWGERGAGEPVPLAAAGLHRVFESVAAERPEATALVCGEERLSYGELDRRASRLARRLLALGAGPGVPVGLLLPRSAEMVLAVLAVLKTGGAYVPIDPTYPADRVAFVLGDSGVPVLVSESSLARGLQGGQPARLDGSARARVLLLDEERAGLAGEWAGEPADSRAIDPRADLGPHSPAYVIYTSGSTGRPKGVVVTHGNALRLFTATDAWFGFGPEDAWTLFHSYAFDFSVWELWGALLHGGRLVVVPWQVSRSPEAFYELLGREGVTVLNQTPSAFRQLLWAEESARARGAGALALRWVVFGGEALEPASLAPWFERHGEESPRLVNMYGITETTVHVTFRPLTLRDAQVGTGSRIGRPLPDLGLYLLDAQGRPVPIGVPGEIHVGGAGVATEYLGRPELTAERFVPDPFGGNGAPGARLYRSGDLGRYLPDGDVEYLGRIDHQVKIRGFRIELGEIETALARCPGVREAVVLAREDEGHERRLVAYVVADLGSTPTLGEVRDHLEGSLPDYMLPSALVHLEAMPLTAHGKVDRRALPAPEGLGAAEGDPVEPSGEIERFLAGLFEEILKAERVGAHDDFFALGGDSIKGAVLINRLQQELREIVHVVAIFDAPTVARLAAYMVAEHPTAVARLWGSDALAGAGASFPGAEGTGPAADLAETPQTAGTPEITEDDLALFRSLVPPRPPLGLDTYGPRNPRAVFVLSPPRSGSTLLRVMLGGHPRLFAPPELELLGFDTLAERRAAFPGRDSFWLEGAVRAVMESRGCEPEEAEQILEACEQEGLSTAAFYGRLQAWIGERVLVDKTPSYALDPGVLARAEEAFDRPFYVHLIRHPLGMIRSFEEAKLDQIFFRREHPFNRRQLAELIWLASHRNIVGLLGRIPPERQRWVYFEDLVRDPAGTLAGLCEALGIEYHPEMARPYEGERSRMTDGPHAESRMLGDVKFHQHGRIDPAMAERWREAGEDDGLGEPAWEMAVELGYLREPRRRLEPGKPGESRETRQRGKLQEGGAWSLIEPGRWSPGEPLPLSFAQERLWFLDQLDPGTSTYNIPAAFRLRGTLDLPALSASLSEIVRRHAALRTTFGADRPVQVVATEVSIPLPLVDLGAVPPGVRQREVRRLASAEAARPFDLARGPLLRAVLVRLAMDEHAALFTMHHVVSDGWSMGVLVHELGALYRAFIQGLPSPLPELPIQYADFALWQRGRLDGAALEAELAYWRNALSGLAVLDLPTDRPRPPVQTSRGGVHPVLLPAELSDGLARLGRAEGVTLFMLLLAGLAALLHRWSGQDDVAIGSPVANRTHREIEALIGFFVNTLVLRAAPALFAGDPAFRDFLARIRRTTLGAFAHQEIPFERIVEELQPARDPSRTPLFQVMFSLQNARGEALELPGLTLAPVESDAGQAKFDLTITLAEVPGGLAGGWSFNRDLFDAATVARMARQHELLLAEVVARRPGSAAQSLSELPLMTPAERQQVLVEWNLTATSYPGELMLHELFAEVAGHSPDAVAVVHGGEHLTYAELGSRASRLARRLAALGVTPEVAVAICLERSPAAVVAILAVLAAGGSYLPLDPGYPQDRLGFLLRDAQVAVLLSTTRLLAGLPAMTLAASAASVTVLCLDRPEDPPVKAGAAGALPARSSDGAPAGAASPDNLAYVMYTSGSTGLPKGVGVPHRAVVRLVRETRFARFAADEAFLQLAPLSFDASTLEIWGALANGGRLVLAPPGAISLAELGDLVEGHGITTLWLTAGLFHQMAEEHLGRLAPVRQLLAGGDVLSALHVRRALAGLPGTSVINGYGPTENTTFTCCHAMSAADDLGLAVPLGRPISNTRVYLLDRGGRPVPIGVPGELYAGGAGLARGYVSRPELTAERFVPGVPDAARAGAEPAGSRLYRTGDLARHLPDGRIEFLGRIDSQLKVRGFRIEPAEIEAALIAHPAVREAVVVAAAGGGSREVEKRASDKRLVACVVAEPDRELAPSELRDFLRQRLPDYMVPSGFTLLDALPLTPNGKVDRRALAGIAASAASAGSARPEAERGAVAPRTPTEELLAGIWSEVLGLERVGAEEDFFALGGHSLLATRVASRLREVFGVELPLRKLFEAPTVAALSREIEAARAAGAGAAPPPILPAPLESMTEGPPLSFAQERLWFLDRLNPDTPTYNVPIALGLDGTLDMAVLAASLGEVVRRHAALRTTFAEMAGRLVQRVAPRLALAFPLIDLGDLPSPRRDVERRRLAEAEALRPFDLGCGPLLRASLVRSGEGEHTALLTLHHIVSDGWSMGVLTRELGALYRAFLEGSPSPLPELPVQYPDFAAWQRSLLSGERLEAELAYWRHALAGLAPLELPTDRPRPAVQAARGAAHLFQLSPEVSESLVRISRGEGATLYMTLLAALAVLLGRHASQDDVAVGSPIANRAHHEIEGLIGFFVNTLVLRADCSPGRTFRDLLSAVRTTSLDAFAHQELPFEKLVEELQPERDPGRTPLFQVMFALQNTSSEPLALPGLTLRPVAVDGAGPGKFDLTLSFQETPGGIAGSWGYNRDLFERATMVRMAGHFATLLGVLGEPATLADRIEDLPLLTAAERAQLLVEWAGAEADYPREATIGELFAAEARCRPEAVALTFAEGSLSYGELDRRANRLGDHLRFLGVGSEVLVALCLERSLEMMVAILAVLKAGGAYVPLDPSHPRERLALLLEGSAAAVVVSEERWLAGLPETAARRVLLDRDDRDGAFSGRLAGESMEAPRDGAGAESLAYVMFTSGSTGTPKGVAVTHRGVVRLVRGSHYADFGPGEVFLQLAPYSFDASTFEIWGALLNGGRLVIAPQGGNSLAELGDLLERHRVTTLWLTTGLFHLAVETHLDRLAPVRHLLTGGETLSPAHAAQLLGGLPGTRFTHCYGPTESTTFTSCLPVTSPGQVGTSVAVGRPIANTRVYLLDRAFQAVPVGVPGELWIGGDGLARGYLGRPDLTAERFVPSPAGVVREAPGARLYRTGDLVRYLPDGGIDFLGRIDAQVKIRGFRIEPGEIEVVLASHPAVGEAAVLVEVVRETPGAAADKRLLACVTARRGGEPPDTAGLRAFLKERLPDYMVPGTLVLMEELPLTANGKVDRRALYALVASRREEAVRPAGAAQAPRSPAEEVLAGLFAQVLGLPEVGADDDFFALGGHSLLATRLVSRVREAFGTDLPLRAVFEEPTAAGLARRLAAGRRVASREVPPIRPVPRGIRGKELPLSFSQQRLWFLDQLQPGSAAYNVPLPLRARGALAPALLAASLGELVRRHEVLRTRFGMAGGRPVQVISSQAVVPLPLIDLAGLPPARREPELLRLAAEEARRAFDLGRGPLLRASLVRLDGGEQALLLTVHHVVSDAWSLGILVREISALYRSLASGEPSGLPELPIQYADFAHWQRGWLAGDVLAAELDYWRGRLAGAPPLLALPTDRPRPAVQGTRGFSRPVRLSAATSRAVHALSRRHGATVFMTLLAAFQALLARITGQEDVCVGTPIAGRAHLETENLIGFFVNTLVLRADLGGEPGFAGLLRRVRAVALEAHEHQEVPFEKLVEELQVERSLGHSPLFQAMFTLQNAPAASFELPGVGLAPVALEGDTVKFDLSLSFSEVGGNLGGGIAYRADLFDAATIDRMAGHFAALLDAVLADESARWTEIELLGEGERQQLLREWRGPATEPRGLCLHELFAAQVERTPDAVAVVAGDERLSYRQLDRSAGRIASRLRELGAGPEARVAVCAGRSPGMLAALLGVLEAGAAYVPLDPAYPVERLRFLLADSRAAVIVADRAVQPLAAALLGAPPEEVDGPGPLPQASWVRPALLVLEEALAGEPKPPSVPASVVASAPSVSSASPGHLAYLIYTSGSTGRPKGVAIEHRSAVALVEWAREVFAPEALAGVLASTSICFDLSVFEIFLPLACGGQVILAENALALGSLAAREQVTLVNTVPSAIAALARAGVLPRSAGTINLAGEALKRELVEELYRQPGVRRVYNLYGPSEDTTYSTWELVAAGRGGAGGQPLVGRPVAGTRAYLLDARGMPVPAGVSGELHLGGLGLARGYFDRPDLTAERFVPDPFSGEPGARLYRTGDLARQLVDGRLDFLGRVDDQVKVRGFRIEPGEIESALLAHPAVREVAVLAREGRPGDLQLAAFFAAHGGDLHPDLAGELRSHLQQRLPGHMVPAFLVELPGLPLTPNGKVDRRALARFELTPERSSGDAARPRTPVEELLAELWAEVLGIGTVGRRDDFFRLGGHSLLATQLVSRIRDTFGVELPVRRIFEAPTLAALAGEIEAARLGGAGLRLPKIRPVAHHGDIPLSFPQERLWFLDRLAPGSAAYNLPAGYRVSGPLDVAALAASLGEIVRRHATLRTRFALAGGRPVQVISPPAPVDLPLVDLGGLPAAMRELEARRLGAAEAALPFRLDRDPMLRAALLRLGPEDHAALLTQHHIASDGWSMSIFYRELGILYGSYLQGLPSPLPPLPVQYADYAVWQRQYLSGEVLARELDFWRSALAGVPTLRLPTDRPRPPIKSSRGDLRRAYLPVELQDAAVALGRAERATLFMVLLAALATALHRYSGQEDMAIGSPIANRTHREIEGLIGFFVNSLVLRADCSGDPGFRELLARMRRTALAAYAHQDLPFEKLVEALQPERSLAHTPLFQVLLTLQNTAGGAAGAPDLPGLALQPLAAGGGGAKFDLTLSAAETPGGLQLVLEFSTDLFDGATVLRLAGHLATLLAAVVADPGRRLSELPLLSPAERHQLAVEPGGGEGGGLTLLGRAGAGSADGGNRSPMEAAGEIDPAALRAAAERERARAAAPAVPVGPRDALELRLVQLWEELLGVSPIGVEDGFFALGGHSLLAVQLMARIAGELGQELPLSVLFQATTVEKLAAVLRDRGQVAAAGSPLVALAKGGSSAPFFCVHPIGGSVFCYRELAERLGHDRPFYALEARGLADGEEPGESIEEMARRYLDAVRSVQGSGPYLLGGWSFGGLVALEMARQLAAQGEDVPLLALFDPTLLSPGEARAHAEALSVLRILAQDVGGLAGRTISLPALQLEGLDEERRLDLLLEHARRAGALPPGTDPPRLARLARLYRAHLLAVSDYTLPAYRGRIALFLPERAASGSRAAGESFSQAMVEVHTVAGDHYGMLRAPGVETLAGGLRDRLRESEAG